MGPTTAWRRTSALLLLFILYLLLDVTECKIRKTKQKKPASNETNIFNFLRLFVMRMVYGFATMIGADEALSDFMGGIFVPPGADDDYRDYRDYADDDGDDYY